MGHLFPGRMYDYCNASLLRPRRGGRASGRASRYRRGRRGGAHAGVRLPVAEHLAGCGHAHGRGHFTGQHHVHRRFQRHGASPARRRGLERVPFHRHRHSGRPLRRFLHRGAHPGPLSSALLRGVSLLCGHQHAPEQKAQRQPHPAGLCGHDGSGRVHRRHIQPCGHRRRHALRPLPRVA